ncbi:MAG: phosphate/phosphite/phosphonate ABC transporter substrate-binding protein [Actinomycetota bacterium]
MTLDWLDRRRAALALSVMAAVLLAAPQCLAAEPVYSFGVVPQFDQRKIYAVWKPLLDELERRTGAHFNLISPSSVTQFERDLAGGEYDFVYANPYHIVRQLTRQGYVPLVRDEIPVTGLVVVPKDSPITTVHQLQGKVMAVPSPNAVGASLLVRTDLRRLFGIEVRPFDARTHTSVYLHVANRLVDAGGGVQKSLQEQSADVQGALRVIYRTREMPSHPVCGHPRVPAPLRDQVRRSLLEMDASPEGHALLAPVPVTRLVTAANDDYRPLIAWGLDEFWWDGEGVPR